MSETAAKARVLRLERLQTMLNGELENPAAALEALISELQIGEKQPELWERLHAAACNGKEQQVGEAYRKLATGRRLKQLPPDVQAAVLIHAAQFFQGMLGDIETAEQLLISVLAVAPDHLDVFERLERKLQAAGDRRGLAELYATVAVKPPKPADEIASKAVNAVVPLTAKTPLSDETCHGLLALAPAGPSLLDALEGHCRKTGRLKLLCALLEEVLESGNMPDAITIDSRRRLIDLYVNEVDMPEKAILHIETALFRDPNDAQVRAAAKRLVTNREVSERIGEVLQEVRRLNAKY